MPASQRCDPARQRAPIRSQLASVYVELSSRLATRVCRPENHASAWRNADKFADACRQRAGSCIVCLKTGTVGRSSHLQSEVVTPRPDACRRGVRASWFGQKKMDQGIGRLIERAVAVVMPIKGWSRYAGHEEQADDDCRANHNSNVCARPQVIVFVCLCTVLRRSETCVTSLPLTVASCEDSDTCHCHLGAGCAPL